MPESRFLVREVHNYGGFFGGETVTLTAAPEATPNDERTLTIDQAALVNVRDRHTITAGMVLELVFAGERVERAELLAAASQAELRAALGPPHLPPTLDGPAVLSYRCDVCGLWVAGAPEGGRCRACGAPGSAGAVQHAA
jgi:hypothetical protein